MDAPFAVRLVRYAHTLLVVATTLVAAARPRTVRRHLRNIQVAMKIAKAEDGLRGKHPKLKLPGSSPRRGAEVRRVSLRRTRPGQRLKIRMSDFGREAARQRARLYEHHATWVRWRIVTGRQHRLLGSHAARKAGGVGAEVPTSQAAEPVWTRRTASVDVGRSVNVPNGTVTAPDPHPGMLTVEQGLCVVALQAPCPSNRHRTIWASKILARCDSTAQSGCDVASGEKCSCTSFHSSPELTNTMVACCLRSAASHSSCR